jgi:hypothetical protein
MRRPAADIKFSSMMHVPLLGVAHGGTLNWTQNLISSIVSFLENPG